MKYLKLSLFLALISCTFSAARSQDIDLVSGDITVLKGQSSVLITFVYEGMDVAGLTEEYYLKQKKTEFRKPADADKFIAKWKSDFKDKHEPKFVDQFNLGMRKLKLTAVKDGEARYTMIVTTNKLEPGFYATSGGINRDTYVNLTVVIAETANPENIVATIKSERVVGLGQTTAEMKDQQTRIANAYGESASKIAKLIVKLCK
ncbi:MAG TPA: hypothetical protein PKW80_00365 [Bacteroidales bacterium]|nr:hypothetical protein [Bacteroidales bacterium]